MTKLKSLAAIFASCFCLTAIGGENVFIYNEQSDHWIKSFSNVRKITFTENMMTVFDDQYADSEIPLAEFDFFTFVEKTSTSEETLPIDGTVVFTNSDKLTVNTDQIISRIEIFSVNGNSLFYETPKSTSFNYSIANYPTGLYIVKVTIGNKQEFYKIIKK